VCTHNFCTNYCQLPDTNSAGILNPSETSFYSMKRSSTQRSTANGGHQHGPHCNHEHGHAGCVAQVRLYDNADYKALKEIWKSGNIELDETDTPDAIAKNIRARPKGFRVFVIDTQIVDEHGEPVGKSRIAGGATLTFDGRRAYIYHFAIHPDFRGLGLGRALLETCEKQAENWGATQMRLTARSDGSRAVAQKLYESAGWKPSSALWVYAKSLKAAASPLKKSRTVKVQN
jgi:ribosomal protein S18 acetylase RimI-like enzyme